MKKYCYSTQWFHTNWEAQGTKSWHYLKPTTVFPYIPVCNITAFRNLIVNIVTSSKKLYSSCLLCRKQTPSPLLSSLSSSVATATTAVINNLVENNDLSLLSPHLAVCSKSDLFLLPLQMLYSFLFICVLSNLAKKCRCCTVQCSAV